MTCREDQTPDEDTAPRLESGRRRQAKDRRSTRGRLTQGARAIKIWATKEWQKRWQARARTQTGDRAENRLVRSLAGSQAATTWHTPWNLEVMKLYEGLTKAEATALFLLRTEVVGLNAWLASVQVPDILPPCGCGWQTQTVWHVLLHCPLYERASLIREAQTESLPTLLSQPAGARAAAKWLIRNDILQQFHTAKAIGEEQTREFAPFPSLEEWE